MKFAIVVLACCALSVQGLPSKKVLPPGLASFHPKHVLLYVQELAAKEPAIQSRAVDDGTYSTAQCYTFTSNSLQEVSEKSVAGNDKCENIANAAETAANAQLENDRKALDEQSTTIQGNLQSCQSNADSTTEEALACYENQGQSNISPVSSLSSSARNAKRTHDNTIAAAKNEYTGCASDVANKAETISTEIFNNLNICIATGEWNEVVIPELGPVDQSTLEPTPETTTEAMPETEEPGTPEITTEGKPETEEPGTPEITTEGKPETEEPATPEITTEGKPETEEPVTPEVTTEGKPETEAPIHTETEAPIHTETEAPITPEATTGLPEGTPEPQPESDN